jgi:hypothetical protein
VSDIPVSRPPVSACYLCAYISNCVFASHFVQSNGKQQRDESVAGTTFSFPVPYSHNTASTTLNPKIPFPGSLCLLMRIRSAFLRRKSKEGYDTVIFLSRLLSSCVLVACKWLLSCNVYLHAMRAVCVILSGFGLFS